MVKKTGAGKSRVAGRPARVSPEVDEAASDVSSLFDDAEEADELPPHTRRLFELNDFIAAQSPQYVKQYIYRYEGTSGTPKVAVGMVQGLNEILTAHDVGEKFKRAGLYEILVEVAWYDRGVFKRKTRNVPVFRVGEEYERAPVVVDVAPGAGHGAGGVGASPSSAAMQDFLILMRGFTEMGVALMGKAPAASPIDVAAIEARWSALVTEQDTRYKALQREYDKVAEGLREYKAAPAPAAPAPPSNGFSLDNVEKMGEVAGTVARGVKEVIAAFTPEPTSPAGGAGA